MHVPEIWQADVLTIRQQLKEGVPATTLADQYVTTARRIARIGYGIEFPDVPGAFKRKKGETIPSVRQSEANLIRELRASNWPYTDLCDQYGLANSTIANICCGRVHTGEPPAKRKKQKKHGSLVGAVERIRQAARDGAKPQALAKRYKVSLHAIQNALYGHTFSSIPGALEPPERASWLRGENTPLGEADGRRG